MPTVTRNRLRCARIYDNLELFYEILGMSKKYWLMKSEPDLFSFDEICEMGMGNE